MSRAPAIFRSVAFLIAFCCCAVRARAEPIRVTSGFVFAGFDRLGAPLNAEDLRISGAGFRIGSSLEDEEAFVQRALHLCNQRNARTCNPVLAHDRRVHGWSGRLAQARCVSHHLIIVQRTWRPDSTDMRFLKGHLCAMFGACAYCFVQQL
jgi:hypothetical protein